MRRWYVVLVEGFSSKKWMRFSALYMCDESVGDDQNSHISCVRLKNGKRKFILESQQRIGHQEAPVTVTASIQRMLTLYVNCCLNLRCKRCHHDLDETESIMGEDKTYSLNSTCFLESSITLSAPNRAKTERKPVSLFIFKSLYLIFKT